METYKNLKKSTKIGLLLTCILTMAVLAVSIMLIVILFNIADIGIGLRILPIGDAVISVFVLLYAFFGYKKPHGNMLKILFFAFSIFLAFRGTLAIADVKSYISGDLIILTALMIAYVAGRLNKIGQNKFYLIFGGLLLLAAFVITSIEHPFFGFTQIISDLTPMAILAALGFAYTARYEEHKAAGLADKADAKEN